MNRKGVSAQIDCFVTRRQIGISPHSLFLSRSLFHTSRFYILTFFCNNDEDYCFSLTDSLVPIGFASNYNILIGWPRMRRTIRRSYIYLDCMSLPSSLSSWSLFSFLHMELILWLALYSDVRWYLSKERMKRKISMDWSHTQKLYSAVGKINSDTDRTRKKHIPVDKSFTNSFFIRFSSKLLSEQRSNECCDAYIAPEMGPADKPAVYQITETGKITASNRCWFTGCVLAIV